MQVRDKKPPKGVRSSLRVPPHSARPLKGLRLGKVRNQGRYSRSRCRVSLRAEGFTHQKGTAITHFFHTDQSVVPTLVPAPSLLGPASPPVAALRSMISGVQRTPALPPRTSPSLRRAPRLVRPCCAHRSVAESQEHPLRLLGLRSPFHLLCISVSHDSSSLMLLMRRSIQDS
jgi:hypothetical protein